MRKAVKADESKAGSYVAQPKEKKKHVHRHRIYHGRSTSSSSQSDSPVKCVKKVGPEKKEVRHKNKALDDLTYEAIACGMKRKMWLFGTELLFMTRVLWTRIR